MPSDLSTAITSDQWEQVVALATSKPGTAKHWNTRQGLFEGIKDASVLPIHEALVAGAPHNVIEVLLLAYPDSVYCKESSYQRLPLHCACRKNANVQVVDLLLKHYSDAALAPDSLGRLPCEYFFVFGSRFESRHSQKGTIFSLFLSLFQCTMLYRMVLTSKSSSYSWNTNQIVHVGLISEDGHRESRILSGKLLNAWNSF